ncbi:MAG: DUF2218 domain-containing protein [Burkholderiales bacterium]|nr:DUF2218 domain-containing protein [Burkholderiales bacterium]
MIRQQGHVLVEDASRHLQRLCYHFSRKITVHYDSQQGQARFPWGLCILQAQNNVLRFDCSADSSELLARVRFAIDSHVELFSRKNPVHVQWQAASLEDLPPT